MHLKHNPMHKKAPTGEPHQCDTCSCTFRDQLSLATIVGTHGDLTVTDTWRCL